MLESASRYFQLGESPSRGLLRDCETDLSSAALGTTNANMNCSSSCFKLYLVEAVRHEVVLQLVHLLLRAALLVLAGHEALRMRAVSNTPLRCTG